MIYKYIAILLLIISSGIHADSTNKRPTALYIKNTISDEETLYKFNFQDESVFFAPYSVWRSLGGIHCSAKLIGNEGNEERPFGGTYECKTPEGYKAQISFDCSKNKMALH
jgi:hypothetical protein